MFVDKTAATNKNDNCCNTTGQNVIQYLIPPEPLKGTLLTAPGINPF